MKKVVVTGGNGFIGSNLINYLLDKDFYVINIDKCKYSRNSYLLKNIKNKKYNFFKIDIKDQKIFKIFFKFKPDAIFNLAAETHVDRSIDNPKDFIDTNILGTFNILENIRKYEKKFKKKIKLIHVSTDEVYGDLKKNIRSSESSPYQPSSPYSASKASADHLIKSYVRTYDMEAVISNCCNNFGPGQFPDSPWRDGVSDRAFRGRQEHPAETDHGHGAPHCRRGHRRWSAPQPVAAPADSLPAQAHWRGVPESPTAV